MYLYIFTGLLIVTNFVCQSQYARAAGNAVENDSRLMSDSKNETSDKHGDELVESFSDDAKIGVPHKNKIEIFNFKKQNGNVAEINFYSLNENKEWKLKQKFEFEKDDLHGCDPEIKDFNNDGFKDVTYVSNVAARGANEIRKLFVYDRKKDELVYIKNSEDYPNLLYNKTLNCLDAQRFYGGTATDFLKIEGDRLKIFAYVETFGSERKVYLVNKNGKEKLLRKSKVSKDDDFTRYKTFNPPKAYAEKDYDK